MRWLKKIDFLFNQYVCIAARIAYRKIFKKKYRFHGIRKWNGKLIKKFHSGEEGNIFISEAIKVGLPCMIARYGSIELKTMMDTTAVQLGLRKNIRDTTIKPLCNNAGFFPDEKQMAWKYGLLMQDDSKNIDILAVWYVGMEPYAIRHFANNAKLIHPNALEPYYYDNPWTKELEGKRVLVIHPLSETIENQYKVRDKLFENSNVLPNFTLITLKAVQSIGGKSDKFSTWFDALKWMENEIDKIDFDVALIGCGAYGFNLASYVKSKGKVAIHIGGALQLLFGIKGGRWTRHPKVYSKLHKMFNEYWVFPSKEDIPEAASSVENSCYW